MILSKMNICKVFHLLDDKSQHEMKDLTDENKSLIKKEKSSSSKTKAQRIIELAKELKKTEIQHARFQVSRLRPNKTRNTMMHISSLEIFSR